MSKERKKVVLINGSPKIGHKSVSNLLTSILEEQMIGLEFDIYKIDVRKSLIRGDTKNDYLAMVEADAIILTFPLYIFCLPGLLMRFLQDYYEFRSKSTDNKQPYVYAVVNCGFPEAWINREAVDVIKSFSRSICASFRFGILIGGGGMLIGTQNKPFMRKTMEQISGSFMLIGEDIQSDSNKELKDIMVSMNFPHRLYYLIGNMGWVYMAKKNGLKKKDLYRKPYQGNIANYGN